VHVASSRGVRMKRRERISLLARPAAEAAGGSAAPKKLYQEPVGTLRARDRVTKMAATKLNDPRLRGEGFKWGRFEIDYRPQRARPPAR
jgi:hypothetical protein